MDAKALVRRLRDEFPDLQWKEHRKYDNGWDHAIVVLDGTMVFRTPKKQEAGLRDELFDETRLLDHLHPRITTVGMPRYTYLAKDRTVAGYEFLRGGELTPAVFHSLPAGTRQTIARQLADFLTALHRTPLAVCRRCHVRIEDEQRVYRELVRNVRKFIFPRVRQRDARTIVRYLARYRALIGMPYRRSLVHNDLTSEYILYDRSVAKVSIIDFSDRAIADVAHDFAGLYEYGRNFTSHVLSMYRGKTDKRLMERAQLFHQRIPLFIMADAFRGYPCTFKEGYQMFLNRFEHAE